MIKYLIEDDFETDVETYWSTFFDESYNEALWRHLEIDRELLSSKTEGELGHRTLDRRMRLTPRRELPTVIRKLIGDAVRYEELNRWQEADSRLEVQTIPSFFSDKFNARGVYTVQAVDPATVRRRWDAFCECRVPLAGGAIEKHVVEEVRRSYARTTEFTRAWLRKHPRI